MAEFHWRKKRLLSKDENKNKKTKKEKDNSFREIALTKMAKRQLLVTLLSIFGVTFVAFGSAFAVFTTTVRSEDYNTIAVGTLNITFGTESTIDLNGQYPVTDAVGLASTAYTFTIKNTGTLAADYTVHIQDDTDMISQDGCSGSQLDKNYIKYSLDGSTVNILGNMANNNNYQISSGTLAAGDSRTYTIRVWIADGAPNSILNKHYHGKIVVNAENASTPGIDTLLAKANDASVTNYEDGDTGEMYTFTHTAGAQQSGWTAEELTDYRYIGANPNNYVTFNNETWRIIGVFTAEDENGNKSQHIKLIKNDSIGSRAWNTNQVNNSNHNNWPNGTLSDYLNNTYFNSLDSSQQNMVANVKWYLGGTSTTNGDASIFYTTVERGTNVYSGNSTSWLGKVALLYASDYGYTFSYGVNDTCYNNLGSCISSSGGNPNNSWIYKSTYQYFLNPFYIYPNIVFLMISSGNMATSNPGVSYPIYPVVYLNSNIRIASGTGTSSNPYVLSE